jgi:hypothetical protein
MNVRRPTTMTRWVCLGIVVAMLGLSGCSSQPSAPTYRTSSARRTQVGVVRGRLVFFGGPYPGLWPVAPGTVTLRGPSVVRVDVDARGHFQVRVDPGTYDVSGRSSELGGSRYACRAGHAVLVTPSRARRVVVGCLIR